MGKRISPARSRAGNNFFGGICLKDDEDTKSVKNCHGLFKDRAFIIIVILLVLVGGFFAYVLYNDIENDRDPDGGPVDQVNFDYTFHSVAYFLTGSGYFNMVYFIDNDSWVLPGNIDEDIHFNISSPQTGARVEGDYTPDISIVNNTLYLDILVINWNDTARDGFCYQISDSSSAYLNFDEDSGYDWDTYYKSLEILAVERYDKSLGIEEYDEIRVGVPVFGSLQIPEEGTASHESIDRQYIIFEKNCTGSPDTGNIRSQAQIGYIIDIV